MKKQFLMFMAIVILALPLKANTITTQPCEEETITSIVSRSEDILSCLETLTTEERGAYYETAVLQLSTFIFQLSPINNHKSQITNY